VTGRKPGRPAERTPGIIADLALGLTLFFDFARAVGVLTDAEREALARRGWAALREAAERQSEHVEAAEPTANFLRLLTAALASGRAHVAGPNGTEPAAPEAWGWRGKEYTFRTSDGRETGESWTAQGRRIGWLQGPDLFLEPEASYAAAQEMSRDQGEALPVSPRTLRKRLKERGLIASTEPGREVLTVRRTLEGKRREVLHLLVASLPCMQPDQPDQSGENPGENGRVNGRVEASWAAHPTSNPTCKPDQNPGANVQLVGLVGSDTGEERLLAPQAHTVEDLDRLAAAGSPRPDPLGDSELL
jgi:hypothetical protein